MKLFTMLYILSLLSTLMVLVSCQLNGVGTNCQGTECEIDLNTNSRSIALLENATITIATSLPRLVEILEHHFEDGPSNASCDNSTPDEITKVVYPRDCTEVAERGNTTSGYYTIQPITPKTVDEEDQTKDEPVDVYCDMETDDGGWTVFQRRQNGAVGFNRDWNDYKRGFGYLNGDFWLGLDVLHKMTALGGHELRVDLIDFNGNRAYAHYDYFAIGDEESFYTLIVGDYEGTAGDGLAYHNGNGFSTKDQDHDASTLSDCALNGMGAWWYNACYHSNLNGLYMGPSTVNEDGMTWKRWKNNWEVLKSSEMKVRRIN